MMVHLARHYRGPLQAWESIYRKGTGVVLFQHDGYSLAGYTLQHCRGSRETVDLQTLNTQPWLS